MATVSKSQRQSELDGLSVHSETSVGWDENVPPNETLDQHSGLSSSHRGLVPVPDPQSPVRRVYDDPSVQILREKLRCHNGIYGLEICAPREIEKAARIFHRDGFVVVRDLLNSELLTRWRGSCTSVLRQILEMRGRGNRKYMAETGRLPHRYSYGTCSASRQMLHDPVWASMIALPTTTPILTEIFGSSDYRVWGAGGDLCLPGAMEYQHLHSDGGDSHLGGKELWNGRVKQAQDLGVELNTNKRCAGELDAMTQKMIIEMTPPMVTINFVMSDLTWENAPIRQIPGTHAVEHLPPLPADEPDWMRFSTLVGVPAGAGIFRDNRAWHGATPNLSREVRALPNVEYGAPWRSPRCFRRTMPHEIWETLTPHAQILCELVKAESGIWPRGAGVMHPLASMRVAAADA